MKSQESPSWIPGAIALSVIVGIVFGIPILIGWWFGFLWWLASTCIAFAPFCILGFIEELRKSKEAKQAMAEIRKLPVARQRAILTDILFNIRDPKGNDK